MLYLGFLLVAVGVGAAVFEYTESLRARDREYAQTLALLVYLRGAVSESRTPSESILCYIGRGDAPRWGRELSSEEGISAFLRSRGISRAGTLLLGEDREALSDFFFELGRAELSEERARLDRIINRIEKSGAEVRALTEGKIRSAWVLFATAVLGALILTV